MNILYQNLTLKKKLIVSAVIPLLILFGLALTYSINDDITGTWVLKNDPKSKWMFTTDSKAKIYYDSELLSTYTYTITSIFPDCGIDVSNPPSDLQYLVLDKTNSNEKKCFVIYGLNQENLTLSPFGEGKFLTFQRQ